MKIRILFLILLPIIGFGQKAKTFKTASWGETRTGYQYIPADTSRKYPVVYFLHGVNGSASTQGPMARILKGWKPDLIIVSIKNTQWPCTTEQTDFVLNNDPDIKKYGNGQIMITGLSAGGQRTIEYMAAFPNKKNVVYVPMSPSDVIPLPSVGVAKIWSFVGNNDQTTVNAVTNLAILKSRFGGKLTVYPGSHCCWDNYYNPEYRENGQNIYEWSFNGGVIPTVPQIPEIPQIPTNLQGHIVLEDGTLLPVTLILENGVFKIVPRK